MRFGRSHADPATSRGSKPRTLMLATRVLVTLLSLLVLIPACHRSGNFSNSGSVVVVENPCLESPLPSYPPGYPVALLELQPLVEMDPLVPQTPDGISCIPSVYLVAPPFPEGLLLDEVTGTISGTPLISGTTTEHVITAIFPDAAEDFLMTIIIFPLPPAFSYPQSQANLVEGEGLLLIPTLLEGSGPIDHWSVEAAAAAPLSAIVDTLTGELALFGSGDYSATITGTNLAGSATFTITVVTQLFPRVLAPLLFEDDGDGVLGAGDIIRIETDVEVSIPQDGSEALTLSAESSLGSDHSATATAAGTTLISLGAGAFLTGRGAAAEVAATTPSPLQITPTFGIVAALTDAISGLPLADSPPLDLFPGVRSNPVSDAPTTALIAADLDQDGHDELIAIVEGQLMRLDRNAAGNWSSESIGPSNQTAVACSDLDRDGDLDLVTSGPDGLLWLANQSGSFSIQVFDGTAGGTIAIADFDRDGDDDLLVARDDSTIEQFAGDGSGNFSSVAIWPVDGSGGIEVLDLDRDSWPDFATAEPALLRGGPTGFTPWIDAPLPTLPCTSLTIIDCDRTDHWKSPLWVTADASLHRIDAHNITGQGGSLVADITHGLIPPSIPSSIPPATITVGCADLDRDGGDDVLLLDSDAIRLHASRGALPVPGLEVHSAAARLLSIHLPLALCMTDLDGDGDLDLVAGGESGIVEGINHLDVIRGSATLERLDSPGTGESITSLLAVGDLLRDGHLDRIVRGSGSGTTVPPTDLPTTWLVPGADNASAIALAIGPDVRCAALLDADGDGDLDVVLGVHDAIDLLLIQVSAIESAEIEFEMSEFPGGHPTDITNALAVADVNRDGIDDLVQGCHGINRIWLGDGAGSWLASPQLFPSDVTHSVLLDDFDRDGDLDLVSGNSTGRYNRIWINDGSGLFSDSGQVLGVMEARSLASGDIDGDGDADLLIGMTGSGPIGFPDAIWINDGLGQFSAADSPDTEATATLAVALGDLDLDGDLDLVTASATGLRVQWNVDGVFSAPLSLGNSYHDSVVLIDVDGDGDLDLLSASDEFNLETWLAR
ncbi:MAG: FG-GAP-like repeat-containing protein [Planctomycetota bacterium]|nr:FG-GAP-like repeat-containing protein [Planctomycetota bacterium]